MSIVKEDLQHPIGNDAETVSLTLAFPDHIDSYLIAIVKSDGTTDATPVFPLNLGSGGSLRGKKTAIIASVTDSSPSTDNTSMKVELTNTTVSKVYSKDADKPGGTVNYIITINHE